MGNSEKNYEKGNSNNDINDITLFRKKKKRFKLIRNLIIFALIITACVLVFVYADVIFEPLRGIASKVDTTTTDEEGFPVSLPESSSYKFSQIDGSFSLLTDTYLYSYNLAGKQNYALQHGYVNPVGVTNSKRVLIYDKGGHGFAMYSKTSKIYVQSMTDEVIVSAFLSNKEKAAVVTSGGQFSNILYVFDNNGNWLYTHKFIDDNVMQVAFSPDEKNIYVSSVKSDNGEIVTEIRKYSLNSEDSEFWSCRFVDSIPFDISVKNDSVLLVCDNGVYNIDSETGINNGGYSFSGTLNNYSLADNVNAIVFTSYSSTGDKIVVLNNNCEEIASTDFSEGIIAVSADNDDNISVLFRRQFLVANKSLDVLHKSETQNEYTRFVKIGNDILFMGYDTIELFRI